MLLCGCQSGALPAADLGAHDLNATHDQSVPDLTVPDDLLSPYDLHAACAGDYLNSDASNACPIFCSPLVEAVADEGNLHVPFGTPVTYAHNPPASGSHWPVPAPWGVHGEVLAREWWVHNLEHQGIVLLYNCPNGDAGAVNGCTNEIDQLHSIYNARQPDVFNEVRIVITPDPLSPARFAAVAWDWVYLSDTLDPIAIECFIAARYGRGPELAP